MPQTQTMGHTPGPWEVEHHFSQDISYVVVRNQNRPTFYIGGTANEREAQANARLIAAAPDLLAVCRCALADLEGIMPEFEASGDRTHPAWDTIKELSAAIAKVGGGA